MNQQYILPGSIKSLSVRLLSSKDLVSDPRFEIKSDKITYGRNPDDEKPINNTLYSTQLGPITAGNECRVCKNRFGRCMGFSHGGYIKLGRPFIAPQFLDYVKNLLNIFESDSYDKQGTLQIKFNEEDLETCEDFRNMSRVNKVKSIASMHKKNDMETGQMIKEHVYYVSVKEVEREIRNRKQRTQAPKTKKFRYRCIRKMEGTVADPKTDPDIPVTEIKKILSKISDDKLSKLTGSEIVSRPENTVVEYIHVPPNRFRPITKSGERIDPDDLTASLKRIIAANNALLSSSGETESYVAEIQQEYEKMILSSGETKHPGSTQKYQSLKIKLNDKEGELKGYGSKRGDYGGRTIIVPDVNLKIYQIRIPQIFARKLTVPMKLNKFMLKIRYADLKDTEGEPANLDLLTRIIEMFERTDGYNIIKNARSTRYKNPMRFIHFDRFKSYEIDIEPDENKKRLDKQGRPLYYKIVIIANVKNQEDEMRFEFGFGDLCNRNLMNGDCIAINRQPTMVKQGFMGFEVVISTKEDVTIGINPSVIGGFAGDFDGDEMNLLVPQSLASRSDVKLLMDVRNCQITEQSSRYIHNIIQDTMLGTYFFTLPNITLERDQIIQALSQSALSIDFEDLFSRADTLNLPQNSGLMLISGLLPRNLTITELNIQNGILTKGPLTKSKVSKLFNILIHRFYVSDGPQLTSELNLNLQKVTAWSLKLFGFSIGYKECQLSHKTARKIKGVQDNLIQELRSDPENRERIISTAFNRIALFAESDRHHDNITIYRSKISALKKYKVVVYPAFFKKATGTPQVKIYGGNDFKFTFHTDVILNDKLVRGTGEKSGFDIYYKNTLVYTSDEDVLKYNCRIVLQDVRIEASQIKSLLFNAYYKDMFINGLRHNLEYDSFIVIKDTKGERALRLEKMKSFNKLQLITESGAKGTKLNFAQACAMIGQQYFNGEIIEFLKKGNLRFMNFYSFETNDPEAAGLITRSYLEGQSLPNFITAAITARPDIASGIIKTANTGYLQRRFENMMKNPTTDYKGSVRDQEGNIIQFRYGKFGSSLDKLTQVKGQTSFVNLKQMINDIKYEAPIAFHFYVDNQNTLKNVYQDIKNSRLMLEYMDTHKTKDMQSVLEEIGLKNFMDIDYIVVMHPSVIGYGMLYSIKGLNIKIIRPKKYNHEWHLDYKNYDKIFSFTGTYRFTYIPTIDTANKIKSRINNILLLLTEKPPIFIDVFGAYVV